VAALAGLVGLLAGLVTGGHAVADEVVKIDSGNTAWMLTSTGLVLFMTIPGLALFYGGMVRSKNVLSVLMQCFAITAAMTILWTVYGYTLAFGDGGGLQQWIGGMGKAMLSGVTFDSMNGTIPETVFVVFQMTFAIITPALIIGAFAERMKFSSMMIFSVLWVTLVYLPVCHWVWGGGWLAGLGALDYAGGTVVHINAGVAGLVAALVLGKRKGYPNVPMPPHNLTLTMIGAGMLWVGWFGFNAGSALAADGRAGMAMAVTQIATGTAAFCWMMIEWMKHGRPSALGIATGAVAGLVAITPASGFVGPMGALVIGAVSGVVCFLGATSLKRMAGYDDALDAFGVHGIGGMVGAILTAPFAATSLGGFGLAEGMGMTQQVWVQVVSIGATVVYGGLVSFILLKVLDAVMGLRVDEEEEVMGLDITLHGEHGYNL
jgi:Amt family ammonium transporter